MCTNPFIPKGRARIAIIDGRASHKVKKGLKLLGVNAIYTCKCDELYESISYHPDIVIHPIDYNKVIVAPNVYDYYNELLPFYGVKVIKGEKKLGRNYPGNIAYNVARISRYAIHNTNFTDEKLKFYLEKEGVEFIHVKQGYSKCSLAIISEKACITSDPSIYKELIKHSVDVLMIEAGFIELPGLNYGFIGGATGILSKKELLVSGTLIEHPSLNRINEFLRKHKIKIHYLSNNKIIDIGSIITF